MKLLTINALCQKTSLSRQTIWRRCKDDPTFPKPISAAGRRMFVESEVDAWIEAQMATRDAGAVA